MSFSSGKVLVIGSMLMITLVSCAMAVTAVSEMKPTSESSIVSGSVVLAETAEGLKISAEFQNVSPGKHGFHIHEIGSCADGGKAAGGHYNPDGVVHGHLVHDGHDKAHAGDFGNVEIAADGTGSLEVLIPSLTLSEGKYNVMGKSFILHEKEDDFGQPTGNAGGRIACGIITEGNEPA